MIIKKYLFSIFLLVSIISNAQNTIDWDGKYLIQLSDFQSAATEIGSGNIYSIHTISGVDFSFYMSNAEFMFTKNFNSKVNCSFKRSASSIIAPDSSIALNLLMFSRYEFDLSELYTRKFRKSLFESKGVFSDVSFIQPLYNKIEKEHMERHAVAAKESDLGQNSQVLDSLHQQVLKEIVELADFCKTCKPPKKKKQP